MKKLEIQRNFKLKGTLKRKNQNKKSEPFQTLIIKWYFFRNIFSSFKLFVREQETGLKYFIFIKNK